MDLNSEASMSATSRAVQVRAGGDHGSRCPGVHRVLLARPGDQRWFGQVRGEADVEPARQQRGRSPPHRPRPHAWPSTSRWTQSFNAGTADAHMVELIEGSGGHSLGSAVSDSSGQRVAWSKGKTDRAPRAEVERGGGRRVGELPRLVVPGCEWRGPSLRVRRLREEEPSAHGERGSGPGRDAAG